uniref:TF-B3 domain-containing protein n=1 Tax=Arundo donax TaxID=35708 RepID=A0A0A9C0P6_ARUDO
MSSKDASRKPQFINVLPPHSMEKMLIPTKFVQYYIPKELRNNKMAILFGPLGNKFQIELEMNQSDMFFAGGWSLFLAFHGITEANYLLLRYRSWQFWSGWTKFCQENRLKVGDVCTFNVIKTALWHVVIARR